MKDHMIAFKTWRDFKDVAHFFYVRSLETRNDRDYQTFLKWRGKADIAYKIWYVLIG